LRILLGPGGAALKVSIAVPAVVLLSVASVPIPLSALGPGTGIRVLVFGLLLGRFSCHLVFSLSCRLEMYCRRLSLGFEKRS
jgi:hypothetical protein